MPTNCEIAFDNNPNRVYYGGQVVSGRTTISLTKEKTVRGIYIEFSGKAYCHWTEGTGNKKETHTGNETYLDQRTYFVGGRVGERTIQPGTYNYTFQILLPVGLPTSIEAVHGHIRYTVLIVLDRPRWPDQKFEVDFTVIKPFNLNYDLRLRQPVVREETKRFNPCCLFCCCASDPLSIVACIPVSGYTPGQNIKVELELTNNSNENVSAFVVQIIRDVRFTTHQNSTAHVDESDAISHVETRGCYAHQKQAYAVNVLVPPTPPTDSESSSIVLVGYHLKIEGSTGCFHINPAIHIPITIGSYPILDELQNYPSNVITMAPLPNAASITPYAPPLPSAVDTGKPSPAHPTAPFPENDPPSYEQATEIGERKFTPNYPVYRRATSYSSQSNTPSNPQ